MHLAEMLRGAEVPAVAGDGSPVAVRVLTTYAAPALVLHECDPDESAATARRVRAALAGAGYVWPVRRVEIGAHLVADEVPARRLVRAPADPAGWLRWEPRYRLPLAVALAVAVGQLHPSDVPAGPLVGELAEPAELVRVGRVRYVEPRPDVDPFTVAAALADYDRGTLAVVDAEERRRRGAAVRAGAVAELRRAGCTWPEVAQLTGISVVALRELARPDDRP